MRENVKVRNSQAADRKAVRGFNSPRLHSQKPSDLAPVGKPGRRSFRLLSGSLRFDRSLAGDVRGELAPKLTTAIILPIEAHPVVVYVAVGGPAADRLAPMDRARLVKDVARRLRIAERTR